jgi:hypothetical protein
MPLRHQSIFHPPFQSFFFYLFHSHFISSPIIFISFYHIVYLLYPHFCHLTFLIHPPYLPCTTHHITEQIPGPNLNHPSFFLHLFSLKTCIKYASFCVFSFIFIGSFTLAPAFIPCYSIPGASINQP